MVIDENRNSAKSTRGLVGLFNRIDPCEFPVGALLALGLSLRLICWLYFPVHNSPDALVYLQEAQNLFSNGIMESTLYMPLYPILIGFFGPEGIIVLQIMLSTASIYLVYRLVLAIWSSRTAGCIAGLMMAFHPMLIYYASFRLTETVFTFLLLTGLACLYGNMVTFAAIAFTLADLARPSLDLVFPLIMVAAAFATRERPSWRELARRLSIYGLVYVALMSPWWLHNWQKYHRFVRLDLASGVTMVLENNEGFPQSRFDWTKSAPWTPFAGIADPVDRNAAMQDAALSYIRDHPLDWFRGTVDRASRFFTPTDATLKQPQQALCIFALAMILAGAVLSLTVVPIRRTLPAWIPIVFLSALHLSFHASARYRLPLDPLLIILASGFFWVGLRHWVEIRELV